jgi:hypothetical protein
MNTIIQTSIDVLNELLKEDEDLANRMLNTRITATTDFKEHPFIIVNDNNQISCMSILNTILNKVCGERVCAILDDNGKIENFEKYESIAS